MQILSRAPVLAPKQAIALSSGQAHTSLRVAGSNDPAAPGDSTPVLSVIVPATRPSAWLLPLLDSLARQRLHGDLEVVVVDNTPRGLLSDTVTGWSQRCREFRLLYLHEPHPGLHQARHAGAHAARAPVVALVDDDVVLREGWARAILAPFADPDVAIVGGRVVPRWETPPPKWMEDFPPSYLSLLDCGERPLDFVYPEGAYGCNMAVRRRLLFQCGGFNPDAFADRRLLWHRGDGETGLHGKMELLGYRARCAPEAVAEHRIPAERLTVRSLVRRGLLVGVSHSYTELRSRRGARWWVVLLFRGICGAMCGAGRVCAWTLLGRCGWRKGLADLALYWAFSVHHFLFLVRPDLRRWVCRETYLGEGQGQGS